MPSPADLSVDVTVDSDLAIPLAVTMDAVMSLATHVLRKEGCDSEWQFGIRIVDDSTMQQAHLDFMGVDSPTDIMTFPYEEDSFDHLLLVDEAMSERGGDLLISLDRVVEHARDAGWGEEDELLFVVVHGILHILGWDDATDEDRRAMLDHQEILLREWREERVETR